MGEARAKAGTCFKAPRTRRPPGRFLADLEDVFLEYRLTASQPIRCDYVERDRYGRFGGNCLHSDGESLSSRLVLHGHALDWPAPAKVSMRPDKAR